VFGAGTDTILDSPAEAAAPARIGQPALVDARFRAPFEIALTTRALTFEPVGAAVEVLNYSNEDRLRLQPGRIFASAPPAEPRDRLP
jgi:hypothetical protein